MARGLKISQSITNRSDDSLNIFFKELSRLKMLTPEEELVVARKAKAGDSKAIEELVTANLRFVVSVAKQYQNKGLPLVDLIQSGVIGLIESAKRFDPDKGFKFISFAVWWIRQAITKELSTQCRTIRIPVNQLVHIPKIRKAVEQFERENQRTPSDYELEDMLDLDASKITSAITSVSKIVSLETPFKSEDVGCLLDVIPNQNSDNTDDKVIENDVTIELERILNKLSCRDSDVIRLSFGINTTRMPIDEIAKRFGVGDERIRQIQRDTLKTLRNRFGKQLKALL